MDEQTKQRIADGKACLAAALKYLKLGWSVLALCPPDHVGVGLVSKGHSKSCQSPGKRPWHTWGEYQTRLPSEEEIKAWWRQLPNSNVGMALGDVSSIIRIDTEGEAGEARLQEMSGGDLPKTLEFTSGRTDRIGRGLLYGTPQGFHLKTTYEKPGAGQEVRLQAKGAQTVLPPSRHPSGSLYTWKRGQGPEELEVAPAPAWLLAELEDRSNGNGSKTPGQWADIFGGVSEGGRNDSAAAVIGRILASLRDLNDNAQVGTAWVMAQAWNERNDPPLEEGELRKTFVSILKAEAATRADSDADNFAKLVNQQVDASTKPPPAHTNGNGTPPAPAEAAKLPDWHIVILESEKPEYLLRSPLWSDREKVKSRDGYVLLTVDELMNWRALRRAVLAQTEFLPPPKIKNWDKLVNKLLDAAEHRKVVLEAQRPLVIAEFLWNYLRTAKDVTEDDDGNPVYGKGSPKRLDDNRVIVKSDWLAQNAAFRHDKITRKELTEVMTSYGMVVKQFGDENSRSRWWTIEHENLMKMKNDVLFSR